MTVVWWLLYDLTVLKAPAAVEGNVVEDSIISNHTPLPALYPSRIISEWDVYQYTVFVCLQMQYGFLFINNKPTYDLRHAS